jgi:hypothetical protein
MVGRGVGLFLRLALTLLCLSFSSFHAGCVVWMCVYVFVDKRQRVFVPVLLLAYFGGLVFYRRFHSIQFNIYRFSVLCQWREIQVHIHFDAGHMSNYIQ